METSSMPTTEAANGNDAEETKEEEARRRRLDVNEVETMAYG